MDNKYHYGDPSCWILFALVVIVYNGFCIEGRDVLNKERVNLKHKGTVMTIESHEDGDVIDCVDIYKQPAFDHPLIKDLQMEPSSYPSGLKKMDPSAKSELFQNWHKNGECPEGTVPIRRTQDHGIHPSLHFGLPQKQSNISHEYAIAYHDGAEFHGGHAKFNVWNPKTEANEYSVSQMRIVSNFGDSANLDIIETGWMVYPGRYKDNRTRFFIYWTGKETGCYDVSCPGFVQTNKKFALGSPVRLVSAYGRKMYDIDITVVKDKHTGNWWVEIYGAALGYWPSSLFRSLANKAERVVWGGEIVNLRSAQHHTSTAMGSGHFSSEDFQKSSYIRNIGVIDSSNRLVDADSLRKFISHSSCYDLTLKPKTPSFGAHFYYGGPGYSPNCLS